MSLCINPQCQQPENSDTLLFCQNCGSELLLDGRYRVVRKLGGGGFGTTYEALDRHSLAKVLKVLVKNHPKYVELFQQEAQVMSMLQHPGIPQVEEDGYFVYYPSNSKEPLHCLIMEKIEGLDLEEYIKQRGMRPIKQKRAIRWLAELVLILKQLHQLSFFHRDIKPANIMLRADGCLVLIDFGTARQVTSTYIEKQAAGQVTGIVSAGYTPLEQMKGKAVQQSDFYALAGTMIFLLTGHNPCDFYDPNTDRLHWREIVPDLAEGFADLLDQMMATFPFQRPQTAEEILKAIAIIDPSLRNLEECFEPSGATKNPSQLPTRYIYPPIFPPVSPIATTKLSTAKIPPPPPPPSPPPKPQLTSEFKSRSQQELAEFIGPMAALICKRTLAANPGISPAEYIDLLAKKIPNSQQAKSFKQRMENS